MDESGAPSGALHDLPALAAAVAAFIRGASPAAPFLAVPVGSYRALCTSAHADDADAGAGEPAPAAVVLLGADDGALYAPVDAGTALQDVLRAQRLRPTTTTLALRLPQALSGGPARPARFTLWASPAYLAGGAAGGEVWK